MKKEKLRKVEVNTSTTSGLVPKIYEALFHKFGTRLVPMDDGTDKEQTVAIVEELETGKVEMVSPRSITFKD